jgi:hypothetical protein
LTTLGVVETQRLRFRTGPEDTAILFQKPDMPLAFCSFGVRTDWPSLVSLVEPDTPPVREVFLAFIKAQTALTETTRQVCKRMAWFPRHGTVSSIMAGSGQPNRLARTGWIWVSYPLCSS